MNIRERYVTLSGLFLCLFQFSLAQDIVIINIAEYEDNNSTVNLRHVSNAIVRAEGNWPSKCDIFLGDSLDETIVISFYQHNLNVNDILVFTDTQGTELWMRGKGRYESGEKSFIFRGPVKIHYETYNNLFSNENEFIEYGYSMVKFEFVFTVTHDSDKVWSTYSFSEATPTGAGSVSADRPCDDNNFRCNNGKCIEFWKACNELDDCGDRSDETNCINIGEYEDNNCTVNLRHVRMAIVWLLEENWPSKCDIFLGDSLDETIVISVNQHNLNNANDILVFTDTQETELWMRGKGRYESGEKSFMFKGPVKIHCETHNNVFSYQNEFLYFVVKFKFVITVTRDSDKVWSTNTFSEATPTGAGSVSTEHNCTENEFLCNNTECIANTKICNGHNDCGDMSDEEICTKCSPSYEFLCDNSKCIMKYFVCNDRDDCGDNSDESGCNHNCTENEFLCNNTECIPNTKICNGHNDCGDMSDEEICTKCLSSHEFLCDNFKCILKYLVCNDRDDCGDNSDESGCNTAERDNADQTKVTVVKLSNPLLITIIVCAAVLAILIVTFSAILLRKRMIKIKKSPVTQFSNVQKNTNNQNVQPPNLFGRIGHSFKSGGQYAPSSSPQPHQIQQPRDVSGPQTYQVLSVYPQIQSDVENRHVQQLSPRIIVDSVRQSFSSGHQSAPSSIQPPGYTEPPPATSGEQADQLPSMNEHLQPGVVNPAFIAEV